MKFKLTQRQQVKQKMKMKARLVVTAAVFAFFAVTVALTFIFNIGDVRRMFAQTDGVDRYWVGNSIYTSNYSAQWETDAWELTDNNGTGSWVLGGDGTGLVTVDNAAGGYAVKLKHSYDGAPLLLTLDKNYGRLDLNVTTLTGGRTIFSVDAEQYDANNNYLATVRVMYPTAYCGYFVSLFGDFTTWHANATKVRFVINVENTSTTQGAVGINYFSYSNGNNDFKNPLNWSAAAGGAGGESVPSSSDNAIFNDAFTGTCNLNGPLNVGGIVMTAEYNGMILQNANPVTVGSGGISMGNGTFQGGSGNITINGPLNITGAGAVFKSTSMELILNNNFNFTAGTFTHNNGRVVLNNDMYWHGSPTLNELSVNAGSGTKTFTFAAGANVVVNSTLTLSGSGSIMLAGVGVIEAKADIVNTNTGLNGGGSSTILINGTGNQPLTGNSTVGQGRYPKLTIDKASGSVAITNTVSVGHNFTYVKGTVTTTGSTMAFGGADLTIDAQGTSATMPFNNVVITGNVATIGGDFTVGGDATVNNGATLALAGYNTTVSGNTTTAGTIRTINATGTKTFNNLLVSAGGTWDCSAVDEEFVINGNIENRGTFQASNSTGTNTMYYLKGNAKTIKGNLAIPRVEIDNVANNAVYTNYNMLTVSTSFRGVGGTLVQADSAHLRLGVLPTADDMSVTTLNAIAPNNTVEYNLATNQAQEMYSTTYHNLIASGVGSKNMRGAINLNGNLTIKDNAIIDVTASNNPINIKGNWISTSIPNSGLTPFNARSGNVSFTGTSPQSISSTFTGGNAFYNLTINNTSTTIPQITILDNDNATGTLTLTAGNIELSGKTFTLGVSPTVKGTLAHTAGYFLNGTLQRWFNTAAITIGNVAGRFPIGHKENATTVVDRSVYIGGTATAGGSIAARHGNASGNYDFLAPFQDNGTIVDVRHNMSWTTTAANGLDGTSFQLRIAAEGMPGVNNTALLRIVKQNGIAPGTSLSGGGTNAAPYANKQGLSAPNMNNTFYMGSSWNTNPLPISLLSFTAVPDGNRVKIDWVTASEENNDYFTVERSKNGVDFEEVLTKAGAGNSNTTLYYNDYDNSPLGGVSYYRLKQTDYNSQFTYSQMVSVEFGKEDQDIEFNVFPNPASAAFGDIVQFTMDTENIDQQNVVINVIDMSGRIVSTKTLQTNRSILQSDVVSASELKAGMYTVVAVVGKKQITKKLIIQ